MADGREKPSERSQVRNCWPIPFTVSSPLLSCLVYSLVLERLTDATTTRHAPTGKVCPSAHLACHKIYLQIIATLQKVTATNRHVTMRPRNSEPMLSIRNGFKTRLDRIRRGQRLCIMLTEMRVTDARWQRGQCYDSSALLTRCEQTLTRQIDSMVSRV